MEEKSKKIKKAKVLTGKVLSTKMQKSVIVEVVRKVRHPLYKKIVQKSKRYMAHDEKGVKVGDIVEIKNVRPISKNKSWKIIKVKN